MTCNCERCRESLKLTIARLDNIDRMVGEIDRKMELVQDLIPMLSRKLKAAHLAGMKLSVTGISIHLRESLWPKQAKAKYILSRVLGFDIHWIP